MHKAQIALESLMTYGWAVLIIAGAILVLAYNGVFTADKLLVDTCTATTPFICTASKVTAAASDNVLLDINNAGAIDMANVTVSLSCDNGSLATVTSGTGSALRNTDTQHIIFSCPTVASGMHWRGNYTIRYTKSGDVVSHEVVGSLTVHVET